MFYFQEQSVLHQFSKFSVSIYRGKKFNSDKPPSLYTINKHRKQLTVTRVEIRIEKSIFQEACAAFDVCPTISVALKFKLLQLKPILETSL